MNSADPRALLLDVEGTTTSIAFVAETLFPYARAALPAHVAVNRDALAGLGPDPLATLIGWMDEDAKVAELKAVQGEIWRDGYRSGALKGHVYPDTVAALERWRARGVPVHIYSSGSVAAQRLLFGHSIAGDLSPYLAGHFDLAIGSKKEPGSYQAIAGRLAMPPAAILFVSDASAEIAAAREAGLTALLIDRHTGNGDVASLAGVLP